MTLKARIMSFFGKKPLIDEEVQQKREARTEAARQKAIRYRKKSEVAQAHIQASTDRLTQMRLSFERANRRLGK
jgi:hypothetical protein